jgi:DNA polymerase-3 subunit beta
MKFSINRADFAAILGRVVPVVSKKSTSPIYESILITVEPGTINLTGSSDVAQVTAAIGTLDTFEGSCAVNAHMLDAIVKRLPDNNKPVVIELQDAGHLIIKSGRSRFKLPVLPSTEYPSFDGDETATARARINAGKLLAIFGASSVAMGKEETKYYLMGVNVRQGAEGAGAVFCSTDGARLAKKDTDIDFGSKVDAIIPRQSVEYILKGFDTDGDIDVTIGQNVATFAKGDFVYRTKLYDAEFPPYERFIPTGGEVIFSGPRKDFLEALQIVSPVQEATTRGVKFSVVEGGLQIAASANADSAGATEIDGETPAFATNVASGHLTVNGDNMASILKAMEADTIEMTMNNPNGQPGMPVKVLGDAGFLAIVMPMRA